MQHYPDAGGNLLSRVSNEQTIDRDGENVINLLTCKVNSIATLNLSSRLIFTIFHDGIKARGDENKIHRVVAFASNQPLYMRQLRYAATTVTEYAIPFIITSSKGRWGWEISERINIDTMFLHGRRDNRRINP